MMGFLTKILPGHKDPKPVRDFSDAEDKAREGRRQVIDIVQRADRLERRFFVDDLFPPPRKNNGGGVA